MKNTNEIFHNYNNALKKLLLPEPTNREVLRKIIKDHGICLNQIRYERLTNVIKNKMV